MKKFFPHFTIVAVLLLSGFLVQPLLSKKSIASTPTREEVKAKLQRLSIPFTANLGQTDKQVKFYANTFGGAVFVTEKGEIVYSLPKIKGEEIVSGAVIKEKLLNAKIQSVTGEERSAAVVNYFKGNDRAQWKKNLPTYNIVSLGEVYKGVDLKLKAYGNNVEKLFYVRPQADPASIAMNVEGAKQLKVNKQGELEVRTGAGTVKFTKPVAYQEVKGKRIEVAAAYRVYNSALDYGFTIGTYDKTKELVIDPLLASTYLGGTDQEGSALSPTFAMSITIGTNGKIYIAGLTASSGLVSAGSGPFPTPYGAQSTFGGGLYDAFVSKFDAGLTNMEAATFLGGNGDDAATAVITSATGTVYVAGYTKSTNFPGAVNSFTSGYDAFVSKLSADLGTLSSSRYLGGSNDDHAFALATDGTNIYVAGDTLSTNFPIDSGVSMQDLNSDSTGITSDGFIAKLDPNLAILASTYLGGVGDDVIYAVALRGTSIYVAGDTTSTDFPGKSSGYQPTLSAGAADAFVAKLDAGLNKPGAPVSTYLGGNGVNHAYAMSLNAAGDALFVAGDTTSTNLATTGAYSTTKSTGIDAFIAKLNAGLSGLSACTYLGGTGDDRVYSLATNAAGDVYVFGDTTSADFPTTAGAYDTTFNSGIHDTFISKLTSVLSTLEASTYLGGSSNDFANAMTMDGIGNIYVAGFTSSTNFPMTTTSWQTTNFSHSTSGTDAFISALDQNLSLGTGIADTTPPTAPTNLKATAASDTRITLVWDAATDNVGVAGYEVWRGSTKIATVTTTLYTDNNLSASTSYTYTVKAIDGALNVSAASNTATATTLASGATDITAPSKPTNLTAAAASDTRITLGWTASTDDVGVAGYEVWRGTTKIATVSTNAYSDGSLTAGTSYTYTVKAFDGALNTSLESNPATATTLAAATTGGGGGGGGGGGCFIATAAYGSYMADDVMVLRQFRDKYLLTNAAGRAFVNLYYTWSPPVADYIAQHDTLRAVTRAALSPLVYGVKYPVVAMVMVLFLTIVGSTAFMRRKRISG